MEVGAAGAAGALEGGPAQPWAGDAQHVHNIPKSDKQTFYKQKLNLSQLDKQTLHQNPLNLKEDNLKLAVHIEV